MAADFNAGSIEGTLDLNTTPFKAGLTKARADAKDFEKGTYAPKADLDKTKFDEKERTARVVLSKFDNSKATAKADLDIHDVLAKYAILNRVLDIGGSGKGLAGGAFSAARVGVIVTGILSIVAAAGPASAALGALGAAGAAAFGGLFISVGLFAGAMKSAFGEIEKANKAGVTLTGWAGQAQKALKGLTDGWGKLVGSVKPALFKVMADAFIGLTSILPKLHPLLSTTASGIDSIVVQVVRLLHTPLFDRFLKSLQSFMQGFLSGAGPVLTALLSSFMHAFIVLTPLVSQVGHGIEQAAQALEHFTAGKGLQQFVGTAKRDLPLVTSLLGHLIHGVMNLVGGLKPLAGPALAFFGALVEAVGHLHIAPLARGLGDILTAVTPLLPVLGHLINIFLRPLGHLLSDIATGPLAAITTGIQSELQPAFHALRGILHDLVKPLAEFAGSIANLANPTGIHLVATLLTSMQGVVHTLAPALGQLAVALENMIDNGLETIIPLIPPLAHGLGQVATALVPVINGLSGILSHRAVADVILGIIAAVYIGIKAFEVYRAVTATVVAIQDAYAASTYGLAVAQDAGKLSMALYIARTIALKAAQIASAAASGVMTAAQWALNVAMDANPVALVVIAIAALAAGLIYAYKHSERFRDIVNAAFSAVKSIAKNVFEWLKNAVVDAINFVRAHWELILSIMTGPVGAAAIFVITHFTQIRDMISNVISDVVNTVQAGISNVVGWFQSLPGRIMNLAGQMYNAGKSLMQHIFSGLESAATAVGGFAGNIAAAIWHNLENVLNDVLPHSISIHKGPIHLTVPLFPRLAAGGVTDGPMDARIGDNPGGREAVIPLDKYDLPRRGETAALAARNRQDNATIIGLLTLIASHLAKGTDTNGLAEAIGKAMGTHNDDLARRMLQLGRTA